MEGAEEGNTFGFECVGCKRPIGRVTRLSRWRWGWNQTISCEPIGGGWLKPSGAGGARENREERGGRNLRDSTPTGRRRGS